MFRAVANSAKLFRLGVSVARPLPAASLISRQLSDAPKLSPQEFDAKYLALFNNPQTDGWVIRKAMQELHSEDLVPEPEIVTAALKACRRVNDYALAVRFLEAIHLKCGTQTKVIWPWMMQQIKPTLAELGINSIEEMGYDKPELYVHPEQGPYE